MGATIASLKSQRSYRQLFNVSWEVDTYFQEDSEKIFVAPMWLYSRIAVTHYSKRLREICENSKALCKR
jgi:hypothetical protein